VHRQNCEFFYYYFTLNIIIHYTIYVIISCIILSFVIGWAEPATYYIIHIFTCWAKRTVLLFYYTTYFLLFTFELPSFTLSYLFIIYFKYTHTTHILALTGFARRPYPTPVECYIHYTHFTQVGRCVSVVREVFWWLGVTVIIVRTRPVQYWSEKVIRKSFLNKFHNEFE
jgi:hypothetical protein